jgi:transposase
MTKPYSYDLRQKVIEAIESGKLNKSEASQLFNISRNTINLWFQRRAETGDVQAKSTSISGQGQKITDWQKFRGFVEEHSDKTQAEIAQLWGDISTRTISRALKQIGFTRKKKLTATASEMQSKRAEFLRQLPDPKASHLVYVDESGMDERDNYGYGWSAAGQRIYGLKSGCRKGRMNMIAGYRGSQLIAPFTVEGACNRNVFEIWLETCLIPVLKAGEWVIIDNATFHHGGRISQLIESAGCKVVYLPPYSPDLNRIEKC